MSNYTTQIKNFITSLHTLELNQIPNDVIDQYVSSEFTDTDVEWESFPTNLHVKLERCVNSLKRIFDTSAERPTLWQILRQEGITHAALQTLVFKLFEIGAQFSSNYSQKLASLHASQLYFLMLQESGSTHNEFFNEIVFGNCLKSIKSITRVVNQKEKNKKSKKSNGAAAKPSQLTQVSKCVVMFSDSEDSDNENQQQPEETGLSLQHKVQLMTVIKLVVEQLCHALNVVSFKGFLTEILQHTIDGIIGILELIEQTAINSEQLCSNSTSCFTVDVCLYKCLFNLIHDRQGAVNSIANQVLIQVFMMSQRKSYAVTQNSIPREASMCVTNFTNLLMIVKNKHEQVDDETVLERTFNFIALCREKSMFSQQMQTNLIRILHSLSPQRYVKTLEWLCKIIHQDKNTFVINGLVAIEAVFKTTRNDDEDLKKTVKNLKIRLFRECYELIDDVTISVKCRAMQNISSIFLMNDLDNTENNLINQEFIAKALIINVEEHNFELLNDDQRDYTSQFDFGRKKLYNKLSIKTRSESLKVRKTALQALTSVITNSDVITINKNVMKLFVLSCKDPMLSVRKTAIQSITSIFKTRKNVQLIQWYWFKCLSISLFDTESSLEEKAAQLMNSTIMTPILSNLLVEDINLSWDLLSLFTVSKRYKYRIYLQKMISLWYDQDLINGSFIKKIAERIKDEKYKALCWLLLRVLSCRYQKLNSHKKLIDDVIVANFKADFNTKNTNIKANYQMIYMKDILCCVGQFASFITEKDEIIEYLKGMISSYKFHVTLISSCIETIFNLSEIGGKDEKEAKKKVVGWCKAVADDISSWMYKFHEDAQANVTSSQFDQQLLINKLHVVSSCVQRLGGSYDKKLVISIQSLLTDLHTNNSRQQGDVLTQNDGNIQSQQLFSQFYPNGIPALIRSHAMIALGKLCVLNELLAKKCIGAIANEMETSSDECMRNNALIILCDLTVVQTQITNPFIDTMATCLCDENIPIRKQCILLLSSLIKKEYIKWKGSLLYKFLFSACSSDAAVKKLTRSCLQEILTGENRAGNCFYSNFVSAIFYFNSYEVERTCGIVKTEKEQKLFDLSGKVHMQDRLMLYQYMLNNMDDYNRINLTGKIIEEIVQKVVFGTIKFEENGTTGQLLKDALSILCCPEIRLRCLKTSAEDEDFEEDEAAGNNKKKKLVKQMQIKFVTEAVKRNLIANIFPHIIELKNMLAILRSPMMKDVMLYLRQVMSEYKNEVDSMLSEDPQLAKEVEFDMKRFDREQQENAQLSTSNMNSNMNAFLSPAPIPRTDPKMRRSMNLNRTMPHMNRTPATQKRKSMGNTIRMEELVRSARKSMGKVNLNCSRNTEKCPVVRNIFANDEENSEEQMRPPTEKRKFRAAFGFNTPPQRKVAKHSRVCSTPSANKSVMPNSDITFSLQMSIIPEPDIPEEE